MKIAVIGAGNMGGGLGRGLASNHEVLVGSRDPERGRAKANEIGAARGGGYREVAVEAEAILLTVPWWGVEAALRDVGDIQGKILIDVTNPYKDDTYSEMHEFLGSSGGEKIQEMVPGGHVVKAWNHVYAQIVNSSPDFGGVAATVFLCGNDKDAKEAVGALARDLGYDPVDAGPLASARYLERVAGLMVTLAYGVGTGTDQALKVIHR